MSDFPTRKEWYAARAAKSVPYDKDKAYAEIQARNDAVSKYLSETFTPEERQKMVEDNYWGAD